MENFRLCRICISDDSAVMMSIFGEDALWKKITSFANVKIEEGDNLPQQICMMCAKNAINACSFKQKCEEADSFFRMQLKRKVELPDSDVISISSGDGDGDDDVDENIDRKNFHAFKLSHNLDVNGQVNYPILIEDSTSLSASQAHSAEDKFENLPLIPEIELITPQDDDKQKSVNGYQCSICFEFFAMKSILKHHIRRSHPESNPTYECFECKKMYLSKRFLEKHIRRGRCVKKRKNQTRPMQCVDCNMVFPSGHHLGWHKRAGNCPSQKTSSMNSFIPVQLKFNDSETEDEKEITNWSAGTEKENTQHINHNRKKPSKAKKHKGRSRIKLDTDKIALARQLVQQDASTSKLARELNISRTFAWRLRKSLIGLVNVPIRKENVPSGNIVPRREESSTVEKDIEKEQINNINNKKNNEEINEQDIKITNVGNNSSDLSSNRNIRELFPQNEKDHQEAKQNEHQESSDSENSKSDDEDDDDDQEETESADESRQDDIKSLQNTSLPSCSQSPSPLQQIHQVFLNSTTNSCHDKNATKITVTVPLCKKKPRKPNVFMTDEKYAQAKVLVANNATTMELARSLNISQMSAWKLRDNILKGIPLTFRKPPTPRPKEIIAKPPGPRPRFKGQQKYERDKKITEEILSIIKADNNIQYWKISERLAEKGIHLSASSVCHRLKSMGIHRRIKPPNHSPSEDPLKTTSGDDSSSFFSSDATHFLSASFSDLA